MVIPATGSSGDMAGRLERSPEIDRVLQLLGPLGRDRGFDSDSSAVNTALLLYTLLQLPGTAAHDLLGSLDVRLRARLLVEAWQAAQRRVGVIEPQQIVWGASQIAENICSDPVVDSRHLLLFCLGQSFADTKLPESLYENFHGGPPNFAVSAMEAAGIDSTAFLRLVRTRAAGRSERIEFPGFLVFWVLPGRTKVLRIEEVGEFCHLQEDGFRYPATLGLLDGSVGKPLNALMKFEAMVNDDRTTELEFQRFFERHPEFLLTDDYLAVRPGVLMESREGFGLKPDFFLQRRDSPLWDIAELKLPGERMSQGRIARRGLAAAVHHSIDQLRRYREFFLDSALAARFHEKHGLEMYFPRLTLIIGRDDAFGTYRERQRLTPLEARLLTYDDLIRLAKHRSLVLPFTQSS